MKRDLISIADLSREDLDGLKVAFVGDGNNVINSWLNAASLLPFSFALACPPGYEPDAAVLANAQRNGAQILISSSVEEVVRDADAVYTDVWTSMGQEKESAIVRRCHGQLAARAKIKHWRTKPPVAPKEQHALLQRRHGSRVRLRTSTL